MTGKDWNGILSGLYQGGSALAGGLIQKSQRNDAKKKYDEESDYIKGIYKSSLDNAQKILNPDPPSAPVTEQTTPPNFEYSYDNQIPPKQPTPTVDPTNTNDPNKVVEPGTPGTPGTTGYKTADGNINMADLYTRREKGLSDLQSMKYGEPYAKSLDRLYTDMMSTPKTDWEIKEGKDGEFIAINKNTLQTKQLTTAKPKDKEFSQKNWDIFLDDNNEPYWGERSDKSGKIQIEFRDKLNKAELDDWLKSKEDKTKSSGTGRSRSYSRSKGKGKTDVEDGSYSDFDKDSLAKLKEYAKLKEESVSKGWDKFSTTGEIIMDKDGQLVSKPSVESQRFTELQNELKNRFPDDDIEGLANDLYKGQFSSKSGKRFNNEVDFMKDKKQTTSYRNDLKNFQSDIETNVYGYEQDGKKQANYNIAAEDWVRELDESGFLQFETEDQWNELSGWFKSKTGKDIGSYLNKPNFK